MLLGLAPEAQARGAREVVLDEERLRRFELADRDRTPRTVRPPSPELVVTVAAESAGSMVRGDFTLVLVYAATASGGQMGRFAHLFPPAQAEAIRETVRAARESTERLPVQVLHKASYHRHVDVAQVPTWLDTRLVGGAPSPARPGAPTLRSARSPSAPTPRGSGSCPRSWGGS
ncbi:lantibiotic dehydratase [Streptomyces sp. NPDC007172]|uniref:lantibiotic dehydratase n=1 Tax=Streptomyces sp. NPDC007172 TaxID=3364776 RepID=UPI003682A8CA